MSNFRNQLHKGEFFTCYNDLVTDRRKIFGEKFVDLGNYTFIALTVGQLVTEKKDLRIVVFGIALTFLFWLVGFIILKEKGGRKR